MDTSFNYCCELLFSTPLPSSSTSLVVPEPLTTAEGGSGEGEDWLLMLNTGNVYNNSSGGSCVKSGKSGEDEVEEEEEDLDDGVMITDFLNSNSVTSIASSFLPSPRSTQPASCPSTSTATATHQQNMPSAALASESSFSSGAALLVELLWKPAKARKDMFSMTFPEKMMIKPYKYDLLVRSNRKHLVENMTLEMVFADTLERPVSTKHDILIEKDLLLGSGSSRLFRFKMNLCSFHFGRRDFRLCVTCSDSDGTKQRFYSEAFRTFARKREPKTATSTITGLPPTSASTSSLPLKRQRPSSSSFSSFLAALPPQLHPQLQLQQQLAFGESFIAASPQTNSDSDSSPPAAKRIKLMNSNFAPTPILSTFPSSVLSPHCFDATAQILTIFASMSSEDKVTFAASLFTLLTPEEREQVV